MSLRYVVVDEAGNLDFSPRGTRYFTLTSIVLDACDVGQELAQLRRDLGRRGTDLREGFHATEDRQAVRDEVFNAWWELGDLLTSRATRRRPGRADRAGG